jgi:hypothetical protein
MFRRTLKGYWAGQMSFRRGIMVYIQMLCGRPRVVEVERGLVRSYRGSAWNRAPNIMLSVDGTRVKRGMGEGKRAPNRFKRLGSRRSSLLCNCKGCQSTKAPSSS